jgi:acetyltransferase-like isoleucine patch superfamily enzyme
LDFDENGIFIGKDVWIAAGSKIVKGAKINDGAVIGAMSMVNSEIEENGIAVGIPAKVKKIRI